MKKRKKILLITLCVIATLCGVLKIYYTIGNYQYDSKFKELKNNGQMNFQIESKIDHKTIENNGNTIHYFVSGNEEGETIVFLHPAFGDHRLIFRENIRARNRRIRLKSKA